MKYKIFGILFSLSVANSAIVLDLNDNNILTSNENIFFDFNGDNFKELSRWIEDGDGFLVIDKNKNGKIDNGFELFGNNTLARTTFNRLNKNALDGFDELKKFDDNKDNKIDKNDKIFNDLMIWKGTAKGVDSLEFEFLPLTKAGILSIDLNPKDIEEIGSDEDKSVVKKGSFATLKNNQKIALSDVYFAIIPSKTEEIGLDEIKKDLILNLNKENEKKLAEISDIMSMPNVEHKGTICSLQTCMYQNPKLLNLFKEYVNSKDKKDKFEELIYEWVGASNIDKDEKRGYMSARDMVIVEKLHGKPFLQRGVNPNPSINAAKILSKEVDDFKKYAYGAIELQTTYKDFMPQDSNLDDILIKKYNKDKKDFTYDFSPVIKYIEVLKNNNKNVDDFLEAFECFMVYSPNAKKEFNKIINRS